MSAAAYTELVQGFLARVSGVCRVSHNIRIGRHFSARGIPDRHLRCAFGVRSYAVMMPARDVGLLHDGLWGLGVLLRSWCSHAPYPRHEASRIVDASFQSRTGYWPQTRSVP